MKDCPKCYGTAETGKKKECASCKYAESCSIYFKSPNCDRTSGHVSFEQYNWSEEVSDNDGLFPAEQNQQEPKYTDVHMLAMLEFILRIDDYSLAIIKSIISKNSLTSSDVAKAFGVSRQAMHRKILDSIRRNPELKAVFMSTLYRCKSFRGDQSREDNNKPVQQMELF